MEYFKIDTPTNPEDSLSESISKAETLADLIRLMDTIETTEGTSGEERYEGSYLKDVIIRVGARKEFGKYGAEYLTRAHGLREKFMEITGIEETPDEFDPEGSLTLKKADLPTIKEYATGIIEKSILPLLEKFKETKEALESTKKRTRSFFSWKRPSLEEIQKSEENFAEASLNLHTESISNDNLLEELKKHGLDISEFENEPNLKKILLDELDAIKNRLLSEEK